MMETRKIAAGVATAALAAGLGMGTASASVTPAAARQTVVYIGPGWSGPEVRPHAIGLGALYWLDELGWHSWYHGSAHGYGRSNAAAGVESPLQRWHVTVTLSVVRYHGRHHQPYFAKLVLMAPHHATVVRWAQNGWF